MKIDRRDEPNDGPQRRVLSDGVIEEYCPLMGRVLTIPAAPRSRKIDLTADDVIWENLLIYSRWRRR
jgi:hypothetical protein